MAKGGATYRQNVGTISAVPLVLVAPFSFDPPDSVFRQFHQFHLQFQFLVLDRSGSVQSIRFQYGTLPMKGATYP